jgi:integrase/recombinase XerD
MRRWDGLVEGYVRECEARGLSASTVAGRRRELERCGAWMKRRRPKVNLEAVDGELVVRYLGDRGCFRSKATVAAVVSKLRGMGEHLVSQGVWTKNPLRWIRGPRIDPRMRLPRRIGKAEMQRLWATAETRGPKAVRATTLCALSVLYGTGLRRGELARLELADWDRESGTLKVDGRKTGQERNLPVGPGVWRCVESYLPARHNRLEAAGRLHETAFLVDRRGRRMSPDAISGLVGRCAKAAGIPFVSLHQFRHSCAADLLEAGATMPEVKAMLGHAVIETTMRYSAVSGDERAKAVAKHPVNDFLRAVAAADERAAI